MTTDERKQQYLRLTTQYAPICDTFPFYSWLCDAGYFEAPASTKYHGVYPGGLYDHSLAMFNRLDWLTKGLNLQWKRKESPFIIGMYHDLCKCDQYVEKKPGLDFEYEDAPVYEYNTNTLLKGHGAKSVMLLSPFVRLTEEEMLCIRYHMGPYEKEEWSEFDMAIRKYPNVYWAHAADMAASKMDNT